MCNWRDTRAGWKGGGHGALGGQARAAQSPWAQGWAGFNGGGDWRPGRGGGGGGRGRKAVTTRGAEVFCSLLSVPLIPFLVPRVGPTFSAGTG